MDGTGPFDEYDELVAAADYLLSHLFPATVFVGCDNCHQRTCDCDSGVQAVRRLRDALTQLEKAERGWEEYKNNE